ncbi:hypothetical protein DFJ73DRAFT_964773 [Zopfochytrium polystomum]|nr:hypothetical protein DFJ73DRAFT_964773 [Zopfochytrium polystomum]
MMEHRKKSSFAGSTATTAAAATTSAVGSLQPSMGYFPTTDSRRAAGVPLQAVNLQSAFTLNQTHNHFQGHQPQPPNPSTTTSTSGYAASAFHHQQHQLLNGVTLALQQHLSSWSPTALAQTQPTAAFAASHTSEPRLHLHESVLAALLRANLPAASAAQLNYLTATAPPTVATAFPNGMGVGAASTLPSPSVALPSAAAGLHGALPPPSSNPGGVHRFADHHDHLHAAALVAALTDDLCRLRALCDATAADAAALRARLAEMRDGEARLVALVGALLARIGADGERGGEPAPPGADLPSGAAVRADLRWDSGTELFGGAEQKRDRVGAEDGSGWEGGARSRTRTASADSAVENAAWVDAVEDSTSSSAAAAGAAGETVKRANKPRSPTRGDLPKLAHPHTHGGSGGDGRPVVKTVLQAMSEAALAAQLPPPVYTEGGSARQHDHSPAAAAGLHNNTVAAWLMNAALPLPPPSALPQVLSFPPATAAAGANAQTKPLSTTAVRKSAPLHGSTTPAAAIEPSTRTESSGRLQGRPRISLLDLPDSLLVAVLVFSVQPAPSCGGGDVSQRRAAMAALWRQRAVSKAWSVIVARALATVAAVWTDIRTFSTRPAGGHNDSSPYQRPASVPSLRRSLSYYDLHSPARRLAITFCPAAGDGGDDAVRVPPASATVVVELLEHPDARFDAPTQRFRPGLLPSGARTCAAVVVYWRRRRGAANAAVWRFTPRCEIDGRPAVTGGGGGGECRSSDSCGGGGGGEIEVRCAVRECDAATQIAANPEFDAERRRTGRARGTGGGAGLWAKGVRQSVVGWAVGRVAGMLGGGAPGERADDAVQDRDQEFDGERFREFDAWRQMQEEAVYAVEVAVTDAFVPTYALFGLGGESV